MRLAPPLLVDLEQILQLEVGIVGSLLHVCIILGDGAAEAFHPKESHSLISH